MKEEQNQDKSETEGARRATEVSDLSTQKHAADDPEVKGPRKRHKYTESYKRKVTAHLSELRKTGVEIGGYLRQEGLYYSMAMKWEKKFNDTGKPLGSVSKEKALQEKIRMLEKELERTRKRLSKAEMIVDFQKKISQLLNPDQEEEK